MAVLRNISDAFSGNYKYPVRSSELYDDLIHDLNIPTPADDKRNLEMDRRAIAGDFNKAFEDYRVDHAL